MAIFDKELIDNTSDRTNTDITLNPALGSPATREINPDLGGFEVFGASPSFSGGMTIEQMSNLTNYRQSPSFSSPFQMVPRSELLANQRYSLYERNKNLENIYGLQQGWASQLANGVVKMGATALGTFAQSFATIPNTVSAIKSGKMADLSGAPDGYEASIDGWLKNVEDYFPNYFTTKEKDHPYLAMLPFAPGSANFWGDKIIKNLGFTVGAIGGALVQDAAVGVITGGIGEIPLVASQIGKASLWLNKLFSGTNKVDDVINLAKGLGKTEQQLANIAKIGQLAETARLTNGFRYGLSLYGSARTEAAIEARDSYTQIKNELLREYKLNNVGEDPTGEDAAQIERLATDAMNTRFGVNMALLTVSNAIQFDNLFKSFITSSKGVTGSFTRNIEEAGKIGLKEGSLDVFERKTPTTFGAKVWESVKPKLSNIFAEGVYEEGGQYATEKGVHDYYTRKYKNLSNPEYAKNWNDTNEIIKSTVNGLAEQFGSSEGIENMMVGAISALISGGVLGKVNSSRGEGKDERLQSTINMLNQYGLTGILDQKYSNTLNSVGIAKEMQEAAKSGNVFKYKNLKDDLFFAFVESRIPSGMHDVTIEQLKMLKDLSKEEFEKTFGMDFSTSNKNTVSEYVDALILKADQIKKTTDALNFTYKNPFSRVIDPKTPEEEEQNNNYRTFEDWKTDLSYYSYIAPSVNDRLNSIEESVSKINPLLGNDLLSKLTNRESLNELRKSYEEQANNLNKTITDSTSYEDKKRIKAQVKALRTAAEKIAIQANNGVPDGATFNFLLNFELNNQDATKDKVVGIENNAQLFEYGVDVNKLNNLKDRAGKILDDLTSKAGFDKYFQQAKNMADQKVEEAPVQEEVPTTPTEAPKYEFTNKAGQKESVRLNSEYEVPSFKKASVKKIADDRWEVTAPDGTLTYHTTKEKADEAADEINEDFGNLIKVKVVGQNPDGTVKIQDKNGDIYDIDVNKLSGYERIESEEEKLAKKKDQIEKQEKEIETKSGTVNTGDPTKETWEEESMLKDAAWLFTSGTTESEDWSDPTQSSPHVKRSRQFLNKAKTFPNRNRLRAILVTPKQVKALGLEGIIQLSYKKDLTSDVNEIEGVNDVDNGFVAQVFVIQESDGLYFVDENGEKISKVGEQVDLNKVVFQTMPTTSTTNSRGVARYRANQKEQAEQMSKAWALKRAELFNAPENSYTTYEFVISRGIGEQNETKDGVKEKNHVGTILINSDEKQAEKVIASQEGLIVIPTENKIPHNGRLLNVPKGRPVLQYGDTLEFLNNKKFSKSQAKTIFEVMKAMADEIAQQSREGKDIQINKAYREFLQNVLFWVKGTTTAGNQMYVDESNLYLGGKPYSLVEFSKNEEAIIEQLLNTYNNVNNKTLTESFSEPFVEYYFEDGEIKDREWKNYQSYLLSAKTPDGKARNINETPLATTIKQPSSGVPYTHKQKYAILVGMELPIAQVAKPAPAAQTPPPTTGARKIGDYTEGVENTIKLKDPLGDTAFTFTIGEDNVVSVEVNDSPIIDEVSKDAAKVKPYLDFLKAADKFDATKETKKLLLEFLAINIASKLQPILDKQLEAQAAATTAATFTPTTPYGTPTGPEMVTQAPTVPVSDVETKRKEVRTAIQKAGQGEGGQFFVTLLDGTRESAVRISLNGNELGIGNKGVTVDLSTIVKIENPDGSVVYDVTKTSDIEGAKPAKEQTKKSAKTQLRFAKVGDVLYDEKGNKYEVISKKDKYGRSLEYRKNDVEQGVINPKTVGPYESPFAMEDLYYEKPEAPKEQTKTDPNKFKGFDGPSGDFRAVAAGEKGGMTEEELELFKQWHAENVPGIPFEVLENIIKTHGGGKAWGVFENGVAKFVRGGLRGTEYHEVFEGIWKAFLTEDQRQELMAEFRAKKGQFLDRESGKKIDYAEATDKQVKERIADDFSEFRLGKLPARSLGEKIRRFFKAIMDFFKSFVSKPSLKDKLFKAIDTGKFKEFTVSETVKNEAAEYRAVEGLTEQQTHEFVQDMTARSAGILFNEADKKALFTPERITSREMFSKIEEMYSREKNAQGFSKRDLLSDKAWEQLQNKTKEQLRTLGISFSEDDKVDINNEEYDNRLYAPEPFSTDWKKSSPFAIKFTLATLLKTAATNQSGNLRMELPKVETNEIGYKLIDFGRAFATLLDKLSNTTSVTKAVDKLINLADSNADYVRLFRRLGGKTTAEGVSYIPFNDFKIHDWRLFINFMQVFTKQKPEALIQYKSGTEVYSRPADIFTAAKETEKGWIENMKTLSKEQDSIIRRDGKVYKINSNAVKAMPISQPQDALTFLGEIGINLSMDDYLRMKDRNKFMKSVAKIHSYLGTNESIASITGATLGIGGPLAELSEMYVKATNPNQENTHFNVNGKRTQNYADNNAASLFENTFNESATLDELLQKMPQLNDMFSANSQVLKKGGQFFDEDGNRIKTIKVKHIEGTKVVDRDKGITSAKLNLGDRFIQEINQNLKGNYYILIPADSSTEWMMEMGNTISFSDVDSGRAWSKIYTAFNGYLLDDINIALDWKNRSKLDNVKPRAKELRFFKDILNDKDLKNINEMVERGATLDEIKDYLRENATSINESVKQYIDSTVEQTTSILKENKKIITTDKGFAYPELIDTFALSKGVSIDKFKMSEKDVQSVITFANVNYIINNIEYHKILFGDPFQFAIKEKGGKVILDETKRIKSFLSPRRTTFDHPEYNNFLNRDFNKAGEIELQPGDPGYHNHKSYTNTVTFKDVNVAGSLANIIPAYGEVNEADAMSWLMDGTYREIKLKNGQWTDEAEAWHQWQMAFTRQNLPGYKYTNAALEKQDKEMISKPAPKYTIEVLKPIVSGVKHGKATIDTVLDKFSQMPVYYSMVKGTTLEKLYLQMMNQGVGYAIVESGRKVGSEGKHSLYNSDGSFNENAFNNNVQVPWSAYGIQVETTYEGEKQQTRGSQLTKLSSMDLFDNGEASEDAKKEYARNKDILDKMHENGYKELLEKLGIEDLGTEFVLLKENHKTVSEVLMNEMLRRELSDNAKDTVQVDENNQFRIPFEASPSYVQIRNILYSMVDKAILSPKVNGGAHVQVPATMFEAATKGRSLALKTKDGWKKITKQEYEKLSEEDKKKVVLTDDTLKFYTEKDPYCEIMLPHWFGEKLMKAGKFKSDEELLNYLNTTKEGKKILTGIGFRIPTQAMSSVEVFRVKGFLPQYMGATVVVPSEITAKAGSDFDIDKLNMYLKSVYIDKNGEVKLVQYQGSEEATKEFFGKIFDEKLEKTKVNKAEMFEAAQILLHGLDDPKNLVERYSDILDSILDTYADPSDFEADMMTQLEKLGNKEFQASLKQKFVKDMYKKSLENEYYDSLEKMITLPENFRRLISPVDDAGLKKISEELDDLRGYNESNIKNRLLNRNYMTSLRHAFVVAKKWVGIAAVNITGHSLAQKTKIYIDPVKFEQLSNRDKNLIGDGTIALPHNKVVINGREYISLSGRMDATGKFYISDGLSGYATTFVDVAKDPYIMKIITSDLAVGTFMFLQRVGVPLKTAAMFMNQPIINKYLEMLDSEGKRNLFDGNTISAVKMLFGDTTTDLLNEAGVNTQNLDENIKKYYAGEKLTQIDNAVQQNILNEFLKYAKMAEYNFKFTQAINYDTTSFRNAESLFKKETLTDTAVETNIISSVDDILNNSFLGGQKKLLGLSSNAIGAILRLDKFAFRIITNDVLRRFAKKEFFSQDDYERVANKIKASFLDFVIQTKTGLNKEVKSLLVDAGTSVASKLEQAKKDFPNNQLLKDLQVTSSPRIDSAKTVKLAVNLKEAYDENLYTGYMRELRDNPATRDLYYDIITTSILQGTYQSAISIRNIIPIEDFAETVAPVIESLVSDPTVEAFSKSGWFERNNWNDEDVMPTASPKFYMLNPDQPPIGVDQYGNEIFQYQTSAYTDIKGLNVLGKDRKILLLGEKYNFRDVQNEFVKVPRIMQRKDGSYIDVMTGRTITGSTIKKMRETGDLSFRDYLGYQKVRDAYGNPVVASMDKDGNATYVYKLINLYGDGMYASEYYTELDPSPLNNGTLKIDNEIPDADIIAYYGNNVSAAQIANSQPTPASIAPVQISTREVSINDILKGDRDVESPAETEALMLSLGAKKVSKGMLKIDGQHWYLDTKYWNTMPKIGDRTELFVYPNPDAPLKDQIEISIGFASKGNREFITHKPVAPTQAAVSGQPTEIAPEEVKEFSEFGTDYRFTLENGVVVSGEFRQGGRDWQPMNAKNVVSKYTSLSQKPREEAPSVEPGQPTASIFESRNVQIDYTTGQRQALSDVQNLIDANKQGYYLLAGYAGTGKTTIAENIARYAQSKGRKAVVLAPTNKAAKVLNDKLKAAGVGSEASTIHKAIYGEPDPITGEWVIGADIKNSVLIIDESSMVSKELMADLINATDRNNILIFMGDSFQLEPVGEDSGLFKGKVEQVRNSKTELTEVKRQSLDSNVLKVATLTRIEGKPYVPSVTIPDFKVAKSKAEFVDDFKSAIKNGEDAVMIVATNNERIAMNNVARNEKFGAEKTLLNEGDVMISVANSTAYPNSDMFEVDRINDSVKQEIVLETKDGKSFTYDGFFTDVVTKDGKSVTMLHIPLLDKPSFYHAQLMQYARRNPDFMDFLESRGLVMETKKGPKLSPSLVIATYGYAVTAHKSQGSQWSKVFVNQNFVSPSWNSARWYYTAITRSSKDVIVLNTGNNIPISEAEMDSKLNIPSSQEQSTKDIQPKPEIPAYIVNNTLQNSDGTKRFAQTNGDKIFLNPVASTQEFFDYFEGKEGGSTSLQKQKVLDSLSRAGWPIERIKSTLNSTKLINTFLVLHEQSHIDNNDKDVYWVNGKDLMTDDKIAIETRASLDALNKLSPNVQQEFPDKPLNIQNKKCNG